MTRNAVSEPETTRLTITWSKEADHALRTFLGVQGMKKGDLSKFIEEAVRWRIFHQTVREARQKTLSKHGPAEGRRRIGQQSLGSPKALEGTSASEIDNLLSNGGTNI